MKFSLKNINIRALVIIGYCLLVGLALGGIATIYMEVVKTHQQSKENTTLKQELIDLSNTLTTMYQSEETASLLVALANNKNLKQEYDSLTSRVFDQIDSLRFASTDPVVNVSLDSLSTLLLKKREYALEMFELMKKIDKNGIKEFTKRTIITGSDIDKLNSLLAKVTQVKVDTVQTVAEKKGFFRKLGELVKSNVQDTVTHISKGSSSETKDLAVPLISDTIVDFIRQIDKRAQQRNGEIIQQLTSRQQELYIIKELTGFQINQIMDIMKEREYQANMDILKIRNNSLSRSTMIVAIVGLLALIVVVFFMSWILKSLNEAQRLQRNVDEAKKRAERLLKSREQLIYTITHDIKAPLSSIIGFLDLMPESTLSQKQQYYVSNMHSSASHILDLVRNLLAFHSIENEQFHLNIVAFSPTSFIRNIYESFLPLAQKKKLTFELHSTLPEAQMFLSDPYYVRQIMDNLISNAVKYTPEEGRISLETSLDTKNQWKISVQDNGIGIDPADQIKVFQEFIRLDKSKEHQEGTGLGLPISKQLATRLGGTIKIDSQKGAGATFTLTIPLTPILETAIPLSDEAAAISSGQILFVDDDRGQLNLLSELMKKEGLPYICCLSAYEALDILRERPVDIIFTDIHIPDMVGFELVKRVRESNFPQTATVPIIAFSASFRQSGEELKAAGFDGFLDKPFKPAQLLDIIEKFTSLKRKTNETYEENNATGWQNLVNFIADDNETAQKIIDSFIEETGQDRKLLKMAFQKKDKEAVKKISHKMLTLMKTISAKKIVSILTDFEKGDITEEKRETLFDLLDDVLKEAEDKRTIRN